MKNPWCNQCRRHDRMCQRCRQTWTWGAMLVVAVVGALVAVTFLDGLDWRSFGGEPTRIPR